MPRRIIDISVSLDSDIASDPPGHMPEVKYFNHHATERTSSRSFPGQKSKTCRVARGGP